MKSWKQPTIETMNKALESLKKDTERQYFFSRLKNPLWLKYLIEKDYFKSPPKVKDLPNSYIQSPFWPQMSYLKNISTEVPEDVINLILSFPKIDNPTIYSGILNIALKLPGKQSIKLLPKILEFCKNMKNQDIFMLKLLTLWREENQINPALKLAKRMIQFKPDPQDREKRESYNKIKDKKESFTTYLRSRHILDCPSWIFFEILKKGIEPLAEQEPYQVACILIETTNQIIQFQTHQDIASENEDASQIWCEDLTCPRNSNVQYDKALVLTLTSVCEIVYEKSPQSTIAQLDNILKKQNWKVFERIRQHLYALYPNEQTKPWIQKEILKYKDYSQFRYGYEMQKMIKKACEHFGKDLLTKEKLQQIFEQILSGPSKENYKQWCGKKFTENIFKEYQSDFHRKRLQPFKVVLFDKYLKYFQKLESNSEQKISDEDYKPFRFQMGVIDDRSPKLEQNLAEMTDQKLLDYINNWEDESIDLDKGIKIINIEGLAKNFQDVFENYILKNPRRLEFWLENYHKIKRPIYIKMIIEIKQKIIEKDFDTLLNEKWVAFLKWVLSQSDQINNKQNGWSYEKSKDNPNWQSSKRAVSDFIEVYIEKTNNKQEDTDRVFDLLDILCTQFDQGLDQNNQTDKAPHNSKFQPLEYSSKADYLFEAFNNTRSLALKHLINFGCRLKTDNPKADVSRVTAILDQRFSPKAQYPLTLPEYTILGFHYGIIYNTDKKWTIDNHLKLFPQNEFNKWLVAFASLLRRHKISKKIFEIFHKDFIFALKNLNRFVMKSINSEDLAEVFGQHLFIYYLYGEYSLKGENSLLKKYYQNTKQDKKYWMLLFRFVGYQLRDNGKVFDDHSKKKIKEWLAWRLEEKEPIELQLFTAFLNADCFYDVKWRLGKYSEILDICRENKKTNTIEDTYVYKQIRVLYTFLENYKEQVLECFAKLTEIMLLGDQMVFIPEEEIRAILKVGLASQDKEIIGHSKHALDQLLKAGHLEFLDLEKP